ncbi:MAG: M14 family metallopeptidase, partial [Candidatus Paceibacterota bacterium]
FVGGIHGGYEWNSTLLAYDMMELFEEDPDLIPKNIKVTIIPSANPDGLYEIIPKEGRITWNDVPGEASASGAGRMNSNGVDLNRNFDCRWQPESTWRGNIVSAGTAAFSEPEAVAVRDFVLTEHPAAVIFWHSQANAVYASECHDGILPVTLDIMNAYASAASYGAVESFDHYPVTGDAEGWLASIGIPAITVELSTHETTDWVRNLAGVRAVIEYFSGD